MSDKSLPPLPGSDKESMSENAVDPYYNKSPQDIWGGARVEQVELHDRPRCKHEFVESLNGVKCERCHLEWMGKELMAKKGHVFLGDQKLY
jgi:hypothetical protein